VAILAGTLSVNRTKITATGADYFQGQPAVSSAGTVYYRIGNQPYGDLVIDNGGVISSRYTSLLGVGYAHVTEAGSNYVKDANAAFLAPDQLRGIRIFLGGDQSKTWPILSNDTKKVTVDV